jgi:hypothetical protein
VRPIFGSLVDGFVGDEPSIATTAFVSFIRMSPPFNIAFVCVWHSNRDAIQLRGALRSEVKNILMAIIQESARIYGLEMAIRMRAVIPVN